MPAETSRKRVFLSLTNLRFCSKMNVGSKRTFLGISQHKKAKKHSVTSALKKSNKLHTSLNNFKVQKDSKENKVHSVSIGDINTLNDTDNPDMCSEYADQIFSHLRKLEARYVLPNDPLSNSTITGKMRAILADWLVEVQLQFRLHQETLYLALNLVDRYLASQGRQVFKSQLQLVGVAAMFIAAKVEEIFPPDLGDFVYITADSYTGAEVRHMELKILAALDWDLRAPLTINFLRRYSRAGDVDIIQHTLAKYIWELSIQEYSLMSVPSSLQAAASLYVSLKLVDTSTQGWSPSLQYYSGYTESQLRTTVSVLIDMMEKVPDRKHRAVVVKYRDKKFHRVSSLNLWNSDNLAMLKSEIRNCS